MNPVICFVISHVLGFDDALPLVTGEKIGRAQNLMLTKFQKFPDLSTFARAEIPRLKMISNVPRSKVNETRLASVKAMEYWDWMIWQAPYPEKGLAEVAATEIQHKKTTSELYDRCLKAEKDFIEKVFVNSECVLTSPCSCFAQTHSPLLNSALTFLGCAAGSRGEGDQA